MESWQKRPEFQELVQLYLDRNPYKFFPLVKRLIAESSGEERLTYVTAQSQFLLESCAVSGEYAPAWDYLQSLTQPEVDSWMPPEDMASFAMAMLHISEDASRYRALMEKVHLHKYLHSSTWPIQASRARLCLKRGQWARAACLYERAASGFRALPEERRKAMPGHLIKILAQAVIAHLALDQADRAEACLAEMEAIASPRSEEQNPVTMNVARAELHLHHGEYQQARAALQTARMRAANGPAKLYAADEVSVLMTVARLSRVEGNPESFHHFCEQALELCARFRLSMSEKRIRALLAGAEY
jgi:tetratricopeptide (TPR) repeat protein